MHFFLMYIDAFEVYIGFSIHNANSEDYFESSTSYAYERGAESRH
jgi:hypothetical protein